MKHFLISLLFLISYTCYCQQAISSQYTMIPTELNSGLTGSACGLRVVSHYQSLNYKILASNAYINYGVSLDMPIKLKNGDKIGLGYNYLSDVGGSSVFSNTGHSVSLAYLKSVAIVDGNPSFISFGLCTGIVKNSISLTGLRWPSQIGSQGYDPTANSGENAKGSILYPNVNLGLAFKGHITSSISTNSGISINHINNPNVSLLGRNYPLKSRIILYTRTDIKLTDKWSINPSLYYTEQAPHNFYMIGTDMTYNFNIRNSISFGGGYAKNNQPYINIAANIKKVSIGMNYGFSERNFSNKWECILSYQITSNKCM